MYYLDYNKEETKKFLCETYVWQWYSLYHKENRTAYFTNNYYLSKKRGINLPFSEFFEIIQAKQLDTRTLALTNPQKHYTENKTYKKHLSK